MSILHPFDEIEIRHGSNLATLTAKQIEAAQLQAELNKWLAQGNQINQAVGHCNKAQPFNNGHVLNEKAAKNEGWKKFEIEPKDKPKKPKPVRTSLHPSTIRAMQMQQDILAHLTKNGATDVAQLTRLHDVTRQTIDLHLSKLLANNLIDHVATLGTTRFYNIKGKGLQGKQIKTNNSNARRGENTRAEIMQFLKSKGCPQKMRAISKSIDQCDTSTIKHVKILIENGLVRVVDPAAYPKMYEVVK